MADDQDYNNSHTASLAVASQFEGPPFPPALASPASIPSTTTAFPTVPLHAHKKPPTDVPQCDENWTDWDPPPLWCCRHRRFESHEDAARHNGYKDANGGNTMHGQNTAPHVPVPMTGKGWTVTRCGECDGARASRDHGSYVRDIQRRMEPMVESLARLEERVRVLTEHVMREGRTFAHSSSVDSKGSGDGLGPDRHDGQKQRHEHGSWH